MTSMTGKERFVAALNGHPVDRPPAASIVSVATYELMDLTGAHIPAANVEPEAMARLAAGAHDVMGFDSVMPIFSIAQEAGALGVEFHPMRLGARRGDLARDHHHPALHRL